MGGGQIETWGLPRYPQKFKHCSYTTQSSGSYIAHDFVGHFEGNDIVDDLAHDFLALASQFGSRSPFGYSTCRIEWLTRGM